MKKEQKLNLHTKPQMGYDTVLGTFKITDILKRISKVLIVLICYPLLFPAVFIGLPIAAFIELGLYIIKGVEFDGDITFMPMEWTIELPYYFTDKY